MYNRIKMWYDATMKNALKIASAPLAVAAVILAVVLGVPHAKAQAPTPAPVKVEIVSAEPTQTPTPVPPAAAPAPAKRSIVVDPNVAHTDPAVDTPPNSSGVPTPRAGTAQNGSVTIDGSNPTPPPAP